jgi:hypothetical protein
MAQWWNDTERENEVLGKKPFPVPFDSPQIPHDLAYS